MKESPILFSAPMVRAILDGRKTQTRRILRTDAPHVYCISDGVTAEWGPADEDGDPIDAPPFRCPYGATGDRLWVRETWAVVDDHHDTVSLEAALDSARKGCPWAGIIYKAGHGGGAYDEDHRVGGCWRPSIHMPRWASRLTLEVTDVRVERLQSITERDARAEGMERSVDGRWLEPGPDGPTLSTARDAFAKLWDSINGEHAAWASDPWVWAISFRRVP